MIPYHRSPQQIIPSSAVKIVGLGGAGANMLERVALDGTEGAELLALNTDVRTLSACVAGEKIQLGRNLTKGLGSGGDPDLGYQSMLEAEVEVRESLRGRRIVFLCVGLGGGTGSGAAPILTRIAREEGAFVVVFATMPFAFEGRRRREQAETTLNELAVLANALVTFDNNRMGELVLAKQGIHDAFAAADHMVSESIKAVIRLVVRPGLINIGLDDLMSALRTNRSRCLFGSGIAKGKDRAASALRNALASPLLDQGALLKEAQTVLVHLSGGEDLTLYEVELLMQRLQKFVPADAHVLFGAVVDSAMGDSLSVTLISALPEDSLIAAPRAESASADDVSGTDRASDKATKRAAAPSQNILSDHEPATSVKVRRSTTPSAVPESPSLFNEDVPPQVPATEPELPPVAAPELTDFEEPVAAAASVDDQVAGDLPPAGHAAVFKPVKRTQHPTKPTWRKAPVGESGEGVETPPERFVAEHVVRSEAVPPVIQAGHEPFASEGEPEPPKLKLGVKSPSPQNELAFDSTPRGRFEGQVPNVVDGEDLDLPPFLRKKKQG